MEELKKFLCFLTEALGPEYEVVYYSLDEDGKGKVSIGGLSSRNLHHVGDPMPEKIAQFIREGKLAPGKYMTSQTTIYNQEKLANTSLYYLQNDGKGPDGVLAVSLIENKYFELIQELMYVSNLDTKMAMPFSLLTGLKDRENCICAETAVGQSDAESLADKARTKMDEILRRYMGNDVKDSTKYYPARRREIMVELEAAGVFTVKGMVSEAADRLFCSEVSIYRYLSDIRKE